MNLEEIFKSGIVDGFRSTVSELVVILVKNNNSPFVDGVACLLAAAVSLQRSTVDPANAVEDIGKAVAATLRRHPEVLDLVHEDVTRLIEEMNKDEKEGSETAAQGPVPS